MKLSNLITFDVAYYRAQYNDLEGLTDEQLEQHYFQFGYNEGRMSHEFCIRENFITQFADVSALEIGPFASPVLVHDKAKYLDVLSTEQLRERATQLGLPTDNLQHIHYVSPNGSLEIVKEKFDVVMSSHNLEHQTDIITHLQHVAGLLNTGGKYAMMIPNSAYCFDADLPLTKISEILNAYQDRRKRHTLGSIVEHRALTTHNDTVQHWASPKTRPYKPLDVERVRAGIREFEGSDGSYIDVHAWQFDPFSLSDMLRALIELEYIPFREVICYGPVLNRGEFCIEVKL